MNSDQNNKLQKKVLGTVVDSFTMHDVDRVLLLRWECDDQLKEGDSIDVEFTDGSSVTSQVLDAFLQKGKDFNYGFENVVSVRVKNIGFPSDLKNIVGSNVFHSEKK